jgi:hypothetical protein
MTACVKIRWIQCGSVVARPGVSAQPRLTTYCFPLLPRTKSVHRGSVFEHSPGTRCSYERLTSAVSGVPSNPVTCAAAAVFGAGVRFCR